MAKLKQQRVLVGININGERSEHELTIEHRDMLRAEQAGALLKLPVEVMKLPLTALTLSAWAALKRERLLDPDIKAGRFLNEVCEGVQAIKSDPDDPADDGSVDVDPTHSGPGTT